MQVLLGRCPGAAGRRLPGRHPDAAPVPRPVHAPAVTARCKRIIDMSTCLQSPERRQVQEPWVPMSASQCGLPPSIPNRQAEAQQQQQQPVLTVHTQGTFHFRTFLSTCRAEPGGGGRAAGAAAAQAGAAAAPRAAADGAAVHPVAGAGAVAPRLARHAPGRSPTTSRCINTLCYVTSRWSSSYRSTPNEDSQGGTDTQHAKPISWQEHCRRQCSLCYFPYV